MVGGGGGVSVQGVGTQKPTLQMHYDFLLLVLFAAEPFAIAIPLPAGWVKNAVYLYIIFEILRIHLCWSCKGQCAHPSEIQCFWDDHPSCYTHCLAPWYHHPGWLSRKHQVTYNLPPVCVSGMLLRFFVNMYDQEIIEEEAFLHWKEEVNDEYPGKGKALFQVNNNYGFYVLFSNWGT